MLMSASRCIVPAISNYQKAVSGKTHRCASVWRDVSPLTPFYPFSTERSPLQVPQLVMYVTRDGRLIAHDLPGAAGRVGRVGVGFSLVTVFGPFLC